MNIRSWRVAILIAAGALFLSTQSWALNRVALVIGNSNYANEPHLVNPSRDAQAVAAALKKAGFQSVTLLTDADVHGLNDALHAFQDQALGADVAVLYYAGHGMEMNGVNYLIPVDAKLKTDRDLSYEAVTQDLAQQAAGGAKLLSLVVLDACRDNPFASQMTITSGGKRSLSRGLAPVNEDELSANSIIEYAAQSGTTASDGDPSVGHSPFASAFINHVGEPGVEITLLFGKVRDDVWTVTNKEQRPASYGSHGGEPVYLVPPDARLGFGPAPASRPQVSPPAPPIAGAAAAQSRALDPTPRNVAGGPAISPELVAWQFVVATADPVAIQNYLNRYPNAQYAAVAKRHLAALLTSPTPAATTFDILNKGYAMSRNLDYAGAVSMYAGAAQTGSAAGEYSLAVSYANGHGVTKDVNKAVELYLAAAKQDHAIAELNLGLMLQSGMSGSTPPDYASAKQLYENAAAQGYASAMAQLGVLYAKGLGVPKDEAEAQQLYQSAAAAGNAPAMSNIGVKYAQGKLLPQDFALAVAWDEAAANEGNAIAQANLALLYFQGRGVDRDPARARILMTKAAAQGNATALGWLKLNPG